MGKAVEVRITGTVQGVSFRAYAREQARELGGTGWIRNEREGSVAGHFEGPDAAVDALVDWCWDGPPSAQVTDVVVTDASPTAARTFVIR